MEFPEPVIEIAIEPKSKADQEKLGVALAKLAAEDPSFRVSTDHESGQTILKGMDITVCTTAKTDDEARALLTAFNFPFRQ